MIKFEWMMSYAICDGMFDNAFLAFEDAKRVKENSETIVIVATKPAAFLDVSPKYIYGLDIPEQKIEKNYCYHYQCFRGRKWNQPRKAMFRKCRVRQKWR